MRDLKGARVVAGALVEASEEELGTDGNAGGWMDLSIMMEEYLDGPEVDVDLVLSRKQAVYGAITDNWPTVEPYFNETGSNCPSLLPRKEQLELLALGIQAVQCMGFDAGVVPCTPASLTRGRSDTWSHVQHSCAELPGRWCCQHLCLPALGLPCATRRQEVCMHYIAGLDSAACQDLVPTSGACGSSRRAAKRCSVVCRGLVRHLHNGSGDCRSVSCGAQVHEPRCQAHRGQCPHGRRARQEHKLDRLGCGPGGATAARLLWHPLLPRRVSGASEGAGRAQCQRNGATPAVLDCLPHVPRGFERAAPPLAYA